MKKNVYIFSVLLLVCVLCACGVDKAPTDSVDVDPGTGEILMLPNEAEQAAAGGTGICTMHNETYHSFPESFMKFVGEDEFYKWIDDVKAEDPEYNDRGCPHKTNIYEFIRRFDISREDFVKIANESALYMTQDYRIDLLYNDDPSLADEYYRENVWSQCDFRTRNYYSLKTDIVLEYLNAVLEKYGDVNNAMYSLPELVCLVNIPREELESRIATTYSHLDEEYLRAQYDYDIDLIYERRDELNKLISEHSPTYIDLLFCGIEPRENYYE